MPDIPAKPLTLICLVDDKDNHRGNPTESPRTPTMSACAACRHWMVEHGAKYALHKILLLHTKKKQKRAEQTAAVITNEYRTPSEPLLLQYKNPWKFPEVFTGLLGVCKDLNISRDNEYLLHITNGTAIEQISLYMIAEMKRIPAKLLLTDPKKMFEHEHAKQNHYEGGYSVIDLDKESYKQIKNRFEIERAAIRTALLDTTNNALLKKTLDGLSRDIHSSKGGPCILLGPTGSGKTTLAKKIHDKWVELKIAKDVLINQNCAGLEGDLLDSTLFGHEQGAFTGAVAEHKGIFEQADGGTVFLDEIGELPLKTQAKLLKVIEEKQITRLGGTEPITVNFTLICGTNRPLQEMVLAGKFRQDLYYRLNLFEYTLPGLKDRPEDFELILESALQSAVHEKYINMEPRAKETFLKYAREGDWLGGFREFNHAVERMAVRCHNYTIQSKDVEEEFASLKAFWNLAHDKAFEKSPDITALQAKEEQLRQARRITNEDDKAVLRSVFGDHACIFTRGEKQWISEFIRVCRQAKTKTEAGREYFSGIVMDSKNPNYSDKVNQEIKKIITRINKFNSIVSSFRASDIVIKNYSHDVKQLIEKGSPLNFPSEYNEAWERIRETGKNA